MKPNTPLPSAPKDRPIWITANIVTQGVSLRDIDDYAVDTGEAGCLTCCDPYEGYARWDEASTDWLDIRGMSIRQHLEAEIHILEWIEIEERAASAPEHEFTTDARVYYFDSEFRRERGEVGFFALFSFYHNLTHVHFARLTEGPFATQGEAMAAAAKMMLNAVVNRPSAIEPERIAA